MRPLAFSCLVVSALLASAWLPNSALAATPKAKKVFRKPPYTRPERISGRDPELTQAARDQCASGTLEARCTITPNGDVTSCEILKSVPAMDTEVLEALSGWKFKPATQNGRAVAFVLPFSLKVPNPCNGAAKKTEASDAGTPDAGIPPGGSGPPQKLSGEPPKHNPASRAACVRGTAMVNCLVTASGKLTGCRVLQGLPEMEFSILQAVKQWKVAPGMQHGRPAAMEHTFAVDVPAPDTPNCKKP